MSETISKKELKRIANKNKIVQAAVEVIQEKEISEITIRDICEKADISIGSFYYYFQSKDDLLFSFVTEDLFDYHLSAPEENIVERVTELYLHMIEGYRNLGLPFMKGFYSTENTALSAYTRDEEGHFVKDSILARSEIEVQNAIEKGYLKAGLDAHMICRDICTIVKGSVFEWCLCNGEMEIDVVLPRIIKNYMSEYMREEMQKENADRKQ